MSDFPNTVTPPLFINTASPFAAGWAGISVGSNSALPVSITWPVANTAFYVPVWLPFPYIVRRVFWVNGTSVTSTNRDFGIYNAADGVKLYSTGSTAASGASVPQYTDVTDFLLQPGAYYFAMACSSTTASRGGEGSTTLAVAPLRQLGVLQQATALPLPDAMTPSAVSNACYPMCGITSTSSGFA